MAYNHTSPASCCPISSRPGLCVPCVLPLSGRHHLNLDLRLLVNKSVRVYFQIQSLLGLRAHLQAPTVCSGNRTVTGQARWGLPWRSSSGKGPAGAEPTISELNEVLITASETPRETWLVWSGHQARADLWVSGPRPSTQTSSFYLCPPGLCPLPSFLSSLEFLPVSTGRYFFTDWGF